MTNITASQPSFALLDVLRQNRLLRGCHEDVLEQVAPLIQTISVERGQLLYRAGEVADAMYLVLAGAVRLIRPSPTANGGEELLAIVPAGDFFGDMSLLDHEPHLATAISAENGFLGRINRAGTEELLRLAPHVVPLNFVRAVHHRVKTSHRHFTEEILRGERLHHIGTMTGAIIHDFKTPLTTIKCACDLLEARDHDETHRRVAEVIKKSVDRMMAMMQELLDYTLGGSAPLRFAKVSVRDLLATLDEQCLSDLPACGIEVERRIDFDGDVELDAGRFERVLLNIIKNAREAMGRRGRLRLAVYRDGDSLVFEIHDNGRGMSPAVADKIFEPFFTHAKPQGTGLGMSMAKSVVDGHRGTIRVESEPGRGTKFDVRVPLRAGPSPELTD